MFITIIKELDYLDNVTFISFNYENLVKVRNLLPNQSVQYLFAELTDELFSRLVSDKFDVDVHHTALNRQVVERLHSAGIKINCWTVDSKERAEELAKMGVDFITSNILE